MSVRVLAETWAGQLPAECTVVGKEQVHASSWPGLMKQWVGVGTCYWIRKALVFPDIPLANMESKEVQGRWDAFETSVCDQWGLPAREIRPLLEELLEDLLVLLAQPAKRIPDLLYDSNESLDREQLSSRLDRLVVHRDLGRALLRYAERKGVQQVDRYLAGRVITQVDQKLVERYDLETWAAQIRPLFELWGGPVPARRVRALLAGRGAPGADRVPNMLDPVTLEWVVEQLRMAAESGGDTDSMNEETAPVFEKPTPNREGTSGDEKRPPSRSSTLFEKPTSEPRSLSEFFGSKEENPEESDEELHDQIPEEDALHHKFRFDEPDLGRYLEEKENPEPSMDLESRKKGEEESESDAVSEEEADERHGDHQLYAEPEEEPDDEEAGDENAIWKKFLAPEEEGSYLPDQEEEAATPADEEWQTPESGKDPDRDPLSNEQEKPAIRWLDPSLSESGESSGDRLHNLKSWLGDDLDRFRAEIFDGSDAGLQEALRDLSQMERWGDAARYLQDDVFDRYRIDLFDDAAVDLTDRMQAWFEEESPAGQ